jgi:ribose transport system ATP-binding protein
MPPLAGERMATGQTIEDEDGSVAVRRQRGVRGGMTVKEGLKQDTTDHSLTAIDARGLYKSFGGVQALVGADLGADYGQVLAVLGENGAGKSTIMKILAGALRPDSGEVLVGGAKLALGDALAAERFGIAAVFQELSIIPDLTVAENVFLRREPRRAGLISARRLIEATKDLLERLNVTGIKPTVRGRELSLSQRQIVEIVKAAAREPRILILDEPTSALGEEQVNWLLGWIRVWRDQGRCVVFISHRFTEVKDVADVLAVYRGGKLVARYFARNVNDGEVMRAMCGREVERMVPAPPALDPDARVVLSVRELRVRGSRGTTNLDLKAGEILGVGGLVGQGQLEFFRALFGDAPYQGVIYVRGKPLRIRRPADAIRAGIGIAFVPAERKTEGLLLRRSLRENIALASLRAFSRWGVLEASRENEAVKRLMSQLHIVAPGPRQPVIRLSGGNQQKAVIAKWLMSQSDIFLLYDVTRGVDVGAKQELYHLVLSLVKAGAGVLYYSTDTEELVGLCHRVAVFHDGFVIRVIARQELTDRALVSAAFGHGG